MKLTKTFLFPLRIMLAYHVLRLTKFENRIHRGKQLTTKQNNRLQISKQWVKSINQILEI